MDELTRTDLRREAGQRTRDRLVEATRALLAERGDDAVTLRDITDAADANVAAVSYHFGCLQALVQATIKEAIGTMIDSQIERLGELDADATVEQIATAIAHTVVTAVGQPRCADHSFLRIMARALADPPPELAEWIRETRARSDAELLAHMTNALPGVTADELKFRIQSAVGILNFFVSGSMRIDLRGKSRTELEQLLIPVLTGALSGGAPPAQKSRGPRGAVRSRRAARV
jgi:AcrR family transcriptional regulator